MRTIALPLLAVATAVILTPAVSRMSVFSAAVVAAFDPDWVAVSRSQIQ